VIGADVAFRQSSPSRDAAGERVRAPHAREFNA
jgi:hypothetical protein